MSGLFSVFAEIMLADQISDELVLRLCETLRSAEQTGELVPEEHFLQVASRLAESEFVDALLVFEFAAKRFPNSLDVLVNQARCARAFGYMEAAGSFFVVIAKRLESSGGEKYYAEAASCFLDAGMGQQALEAGEACLQLSRSLDDESAANFLIGRAYLLLQRANLARDKFLSCLEALPGFRAAGEYLLIAATQSGDTAASAELFKQLDKLEWLSPGLIDATVSILTNLGRYKEAIEIYSITVSRFELLPSTLHNAAEALRSVGDNSSAIAVYERAAAMHPGFENLATLVSQAHAFGNVGRLEEKKVVEEKAMGLLEESVGEVSINPWMLFSFVNDPEILYKCAKTFAGSALGAPVSKSEPGGLRSPPHGKSRTSEVFGDGGNGAPLKVVFISAELRFHPVAECLQVLLDRKPRWAEICLISIHPARDPMTEKLAGMAEEFHECHGLDFEEIREVCALFGAQVAIDLTGYTASSRADVFVKRLAPFQVNYLGFSGTLGSLAYDAIIADHTIIPHGQEHYYSEDVVRLNTPLLSMNLGSHTRKNRQIERAALGASVDTVVFGCLAKSYKLSVELVEAWSRILKSVPGSIMVLSEGNFDEIASAMRSFGVSSDRIRASAFRPDRSSHLDRLSSFDVFLDSFPYNAHSLAADALAAGVPVLAFSGRTFASRVSASLMAGVGCEDLVVSDIDGYVAVGEKLGNDSRYLSEVTLRINTALTSRDWGGSYAEEFFEQVRICALGAD